MRQTVVEKIAQAHMTQGPERDLRAGDMVSLRPRHILTHDNTIAVLRKFRALGGIDVCDPSQPVFALDHEIQNTSPENLAKYAVIEAFATAQHIAFHPAGTGIGHQLMVENGFVLPGTLVVASDSHANTYGALGAIGTPVVRTDAAAIWATGEFWWQIPRTVQVVLEGALRPGVSGKDVILALCGTYYNDEVLNAALEFTGPGVAGLDMAARLTIANMSTEWGALTAHYPIDAVTIAYLAERARVLAGRGITRFTAADLASWRAQPMQADDNAAYDARITLDLGAVPPCIAGPDTVQRVRPLDQVFADHVEIDRAYLVSCVNGRERDLESAARVLRGRHVAKGVKLYVAPASRDVRVHAQASGAWDTLLKAGAIALPAGCGPCIGLGEGLLEAGEIGISATNRNFKGRMGSRDATVYLASPEVVAESAAQGFISGPVLPNGHHPESTFEKLESEAEAPETVLLLPDFPERLEGRLVFLTQNDLNTDGIYGKDHTYRDVTPEEMARVVMANYDPQFAGSVRAGDILAGGWNFGTGSSREQAVTALQAAGIRVVIAASFSQTYLRNAFNNGFICIECPALVTYLRLRYASIIDDQPTIISPDPCVIDFADGLVHYRTDAFAFRPLGMVPQSLVVAGGIENLVRERLAMKAIMR
jgi:homoaconitate hydratase